MSSVLSGRKILLGVSGSIAAYKSAFLLRLLVKEGAHVKVIMTSDAKNFITPLTLQTLSGHPVLSSISSDEAWNNHVELGLWADVMLIAPLTANTLAKLASGHCDNMLTATNSTSISKRCCDRHAHLTRRPIANVAYRIQIFVGRSCGNQDSKI